jgi:hypothetical protein
MKLHPVVALVGMLSICTAGCGAGLTSRMPRAGQSPEDTMLLQAVDAELSNAIVGTTTLTSAPLPAMPLPESRMPVSAAAAPAATAPQTWGAPPQPVDPETSEYGF